MEQRILGDYTIIKPIGHGTLGMVYLAEHRFMKRQFVLKVLPEELASDRGFIQRFEEEIGLLASLDHPNIVKIHNISFAQGQYFIVTDCIVDELGETTNLAQYVAGLGRRLDEDELFHLLKHIAEPLDYAHQKSVGNRALIHRSLKLNNILVGKGRHEVQIYLSDFGLSRVIGPGAVLTRMYRYVAEGLGIASTIMAQKTGHDRYPNPPIETQKLTPLHTSFIQNYAFLAPEQKRLDPLHPLDAKVDVYAFGVLVYFLLMGEFPEGIFEMPSVKKEYRYQWDRLIQQCLQSHPARRPEQLVELLESVRHQDKVTVIMEDDLAQQAVDSRIHPTAEKYLLSETAVEQPILILAKSVEQECHSESTLKPVFHGSQLERPIADLNPAAVFQIDTTIKLYNPEYKDVTNIKPLLTDMIVIPGGGFFRGSQDGNRDEMPRHRVTLRSYAIDIHPVTNEQFVRFLEVMGGKG